MAVEVPSTGAAPEGGTARALCQWVLPLLYCLVVLATFRDYGYSWDEVYHNRFAGQAVLRFFTSLGADRSAIDAHNFHLYGGTFDAAAELLVAATPLEPRNARHLANALAGLGGIAGCWALARRIGGRRAGAWAAAFLGLSAPWYGHLFINAKDIPFATGYIWSLYLLLRGLEEYPRIRARWVVGLGVAIGLTLGVRIGGVLLPAYAALFAFVLFARAVAVDRGGVGVARRHALGLAWRGLAVGGIAWGLMLVAWPAALLQPLAIPLEAFGAANSFDFDEYLLWNGRNVLSTDLPWTYLPVLVAVQLPEVLVLLGCGALVWSGAVAAGWVPRGADPAQRVGVALLITAGIFPVAWAIARGSTLYDNGRHFLFVLPPLLCLAALAWTWALGALRARWPRLRIGVAVLLVGGLVSSTARTASLHPYEYTFLNVFAGGIPEAGKRFDTDYWCTSYREASLLLLRHAVAVARNGGVPLARAGFVVAVVGVPEGVQDELPEGFTVVEWQDGMRPDYLVATTRWQGDTLLPEWPVVAEVGRAGMRFAVVRTSPELVRIAPPLGGQGGGT